MKIRNFHKVEKRDAYLREKAKGCSIRVAIAEEDGAETVAMRIHEIDPGGYTPMHAHPWEHAIYVIKGSGKVLDGKRECPLEKDDVLFVNKDQQHQIKNTGETALVLVSVIPIQRD